MRFIQTSLLASLAFSAITLLSTPAHAGLEACGDINLSASASCEIKTEGGCEASCEPIYFQAACAAEGTLACEGGCDASADLECTGSCQGQCEANCEVDPANFDCEGSCNLDCSGSCSAQCEANPDQAGCQAACEATCSAECSGQCTLEPGSGSCEAQCQGSCGGSCTAEANLSCQVDCQADLRASCEAELQGGCEFQCSEPEGALFCDGQYIDAGGNLEECVTSIIDALGIEVEGWAEASCSGNSCEAKAGATCSARIVPEDDKTPAALFAIILGAGLRRSAKRRRQSSTAAK